ncbi:MAG: endopeptidase La, partial [Clostridia bacterium]|nr:endopeptidase La [Clostridia bacterium]
MSDLKEKNIEDVMENAENEAAAATGEAAEGEFDENDIDDLIHISDGRDNEMPVIPLRGITIFPSMMLHFDIGREKSVTALEQAMMGNQTVFLVTQKEAETDLPTMDDLFSVGTVARIKQMLRLPGNAIRVLVEGVCRGSIATMIHEVPYFRAVINEIPEMDEFVDQIRAKALMRAVLTQFAEYLDGSQKISREIYPGIEAIEVPGRMADIITSHLELSVDDKQIVLDTIDPLERLEKVSEMLTRENEIVKVSNEISQKVREKLSENQKEYYLREQIRTIQRELGQDESIDDEVEGWLEKLKKLKLDEKIHTKIEREIKKMLRIQPSSPDASVQRNYIETILDLPWNKSSKSKIDIKRARKVLDEDHYGLEKVKDRIVEYLAVMALSKNFKGPILCLAGPPGVGKTSIARSVARALNRNFVRMSLGGVRDEAEIRGHRRTYVGAIPGRIISSINDAGTNNPVFLLDEIDKVGGDYRGDPASALLEVLDPEQNKDFKDHFLDVPFDLSKVLFITTANDTGTIPRPLFDRMEVINLSSYTEEEKVKIAEQHLIAKQMKENGLKKDQLTISEGAVRDIINYYTRESGVRNLEREIGTVCRKVAAKVVEGGAKTKNKKFRVTAGNLKTYLGKHKASYDIIEGEDLVGVVTGLAWTQVGGDTLQIETAIMDGNGSLSLTGKLGDVMKESAQTGVSVIRSRSDKFDIPEDFYKKKDIHIHIPEGAVPKDGPSAGVTMCTSVLSALTGIPVKRDFAMTGEITLRGNVLPVGGIKEKMIAAHRAGIKHVLLPKKNLEDLE